MDVKVFFKTVVTVLKRENVYVGDASNPAKQSAEKVEEKAEK